MIPANNCIPIYDHKFGDLKTAWKELLNASIIDISEQAILFTYEGPINDMTMPGRIHSTNPNPKDREYKIPANKYLLRFFNNTLYGTFQVMISLLLKYNAGMTIYKTDNNAATTE